MPRAGLPFSFARDHQVALDGARLILGPAATPTGMREARRRLGRPAAEIDETDQPGFERALSRIYQESGDGEAAERVLTFDDGDIDLIDGPRDLLEDAAEAPVIQLVNQLLRKAVQSHASDLHVEPHEGGLRARMRVDGFLRTVLDRSDVPVRRVISRLKVIANLDIAETRLPQDGRIALRHGGRAIDVRVSTLPGNFGERVVLRVLDKSSGLMALDELGLTDAQADILHHMAALPNGIILATGPTGSGKTTTLYSLLQLANRDERNIVTVEDPIEYNIEGISQSQINSEIGMTFAKGLRATLRQDPDVILVGEIRDAETATVGAQAALTGHLVFSSLHANSSVGAVVRLRNLGLDDFLIASTLRGIIAQRLLRRLCRDCKTPRAIGDEERDRFERVGIAIPNSLYQSVGCTACGASGYAGRVGIFEIVEVTEELRRAIDQGMYEQQLRKVALNGQDTLFGQGLRRVAEGETTMDEMMRVVGDAA